LRLSARRSFDSSWLLALSETHTLALIVDDVDLLDEESQAVLLTLLRRGAGHRLCVVTSVGAVQDAERSHALAALRASSTQLQLSALSADETLELLRSLFGEVPYLARLSARLHKLSEGNPEHCLLLARQLVAAGVIRYKRARRPLRAAGRAASDPARQRLASRELEAVLAFGVAHVRRRSYETCCR
jgi:hypothetical protein